jgi:hypothetical protein
MGVRGVLHPTTGQPKELSIARPIVPEKMTDGRMSFSY